MPNNNNENDNVITAHMKEIQNEIKDYVISKLTDRVIAKEKEIHSLKGEIEILKSNLVNTLKKMLTEKKKAPQKVFSPPKYSPLQTSFVSPTPRGKLFMTEKQSFFSPKPKLNISGYCSTEPSKNLLLYSQQVTEKKITDYVNTLYKRNTKDLDFSQNSLCLNTLNNNTICDTDSNHISMRKGNLSNLSSLNYVNEKKTLITVKTPNSSNTTSTYLSKGMKKKASLTKLSYGNLTTRNKVQMKTINHNHSKVYSYLSPRTQAKSERFMTLTNSGSKYNNKVNKQKKFIH